MDESRSFELKPVSGKNNVWVEVDREEGLYGGKDDKLSLEGHVGNKKVKLVERTDRQDAGLLYSENWKIAKAAGLPVVPTLRKTDHGTVVMTDLTADGSEIYGKAANESLSGYDLLYKDFKLTEQFLRATSDEGLAKISDRAAELVGLASGKGVLLPSDDPFELFLHPDGSWELIITDLEMLGRAKADSDLFEENLGFAEGFVRDLREIRSALLNGRSKNSDAKVQAAN